MRRRLWPALALTLDAEYHYLKHQVFLRLRKPAQP